MWKKEGSTRDGVVSIGELTLELLKENRKIQAGYIRANWEKITGELASRSRVWYIRDDVLHICVNSPAQLHYMNMRGEEYLERIRALFGDLGLEGAGVAVSKLKFVLQAQNESKDINF